MFSILDEKWRVKNSYFTCSYNNLPCIAVRQKNTYFLIVLNLDLSFNDAIVVSDNLELINKLFDLKKPTNLMNALIMNKSLEAEKNDPCGCSAVFVNDKILIYEGNFDFKFEYLENLNPNRIICKDFKNLIFIDRMEKIILDYLNKKNHKLTSILDYQSILDSYRKTFFMNNL